MSQPIRALIVDDEELARSNLRVLLKPHPEIAIVGECESGQEAVDAIRGLKPDLVFLDVQMPECDGFGVLDELGAKAPPVVVFVTAYDAHALKAFEVGAVDYLLKPFDTARFERTLTRAKESFARRKDAASAIQAFVVKSSGRITFIKVDEIDWIEATDYYVCLHAGDKEHLLRRSMAELEDELDKDLFCRIHRSSIVKLDRVQSLELNSAGEYDVVLADGKALRMSRRYRKELQERLGARAGV